MSEMMTWVLVIWINSASLRAVESPATVPGYVSIEECVEAGKTWIKHDPTWNRAVCIQGPRNGK